MAEREEAARQERTAAEERERIRKFREANRAAIATLESEAGAWERANRLRRYLRAARRAIPQDLTPTVDLDGQRMDLFSLGEHFADQLDPLSTRPRDPRFEHYRDPYGYGCGTDDEAALRKHLSRMLGRDWARTQKYGSK